MALDIVFHISCNTEGGKVYYPDYDVVGLEPVKLYGANAEINKSEYNHDGCKYLHKADKAVGAEEKSVIAGGVHKYFGGEENYGENKEGHAVAGFAVFEKQTGQVEEHNKKQNEYGGCNQCLNKESGEAPFRGA